MNRFLFQLQVPLPLKDAVKAEIDHMEKICVIKKIEEQTDLHAGIVVIPKQNGSVRICVDLTQSNKSVSREKHMMPYSSSTSRFKCLI